MRILTFNEKFSRYKKDSINILENIPGQVIINGQTIKLQRRLWNILAYLASTTPEWIHKLDIDDENLSQITKLRQTIKPYVYNNPKDVIENNGHGGIRLNV